LDLFVRVAAMPRLAWSASGAILDVRHRIADALAGDPENSALAGRLFDGLFDRIETQCRSRSLDGFACAPVRRDTDDGSASRAA
jgi:hypothetical protein